MRGWRFFAVHMILILLPTVAFAAGTLKVSSFPDGAKVFIDGFDTGKVTPMSISLVEGKHELRVTMPKTTFGQSWKDSVGDVTVNTGLNEVSVTLVPTIITGGAISGSVNYCGTTGPGYIPIYILGESFMAITTPQGNFNISNIPDGSYTLTIDTPGPVHHTSPAIQVASGNISTVGPLAICCDAVLDDTSCICPDKKANYFGVCVWAAGEAPDCNNPHPNAEMDGCQLFNLNLKGYDLRGAYLNLVSLYLIDLSNANLSGAKLNRANLHSVNLTGANLTGASLYLATMYSVNLTGANLTGANLTGANLHSVNLTGANLTGANLTGVSWSGVICPDGSNTVTNGLGYCVP